MSGSAKVIGFPGRARAGVMVCLSSDPAGNARILLRKAYQTAAELDADWYAVHVDCTLEDKSAAPDRDFRALLDSVVLADMGAEAVWLKAPDITEALLNFARDARVTRIIVGRARHRLGARLRKRSVTSELVSRGREFEIEVVGLGRRAQP